MTYNELRRQYFEDASAGVSYVFHYYQNFHLAADVIGEYKKILRPQEQAQVDIGILHPSTQMIVDMTYFPTGQPEFCDAGRRYFDYDLVDENMIGWGMLKGYRVLVQTGGDTFRGSTLAGIDKWLREGGVLVTNGPPVWETLDGKREIAAAWLADEDKQEARPSARVYRVGRGRLYWETAASIPDYVLKVNDALTVTATGQAAKAPLKGFHGKDEGTFVTDFPSGRLVFDTKTLATKFISNTAP